MVVNIWVPSKICTNRASWPCEVPSHDIMVVPGDVADGPDQVTAQLANLYRQTRKPILFVPGNHDLSGAKLRTGVFNNLPKEIIVLEAAQSTIFKGVRFVGATLWTDFELTETAFASQKWAIATLPEYFTVRHSFKGRTIRPIDTATEHMRDKATLARVLSYPHHGATVVVTHHAPSIRSVPEDIMQDVSCAAFASNLEYIMTRYQPALWIHAPVYADADYHIGSTRIVSSAGGCCANLDQAVPLKELVIDL